MCILSVLSVFSCAQPAPFGFEDDSRSPGLFEILDPHPALKSAVASLDADRLNVLLDSALAPAQAEQPRFLSAFADIIMLPEKPVQNLLRETGFLFLATNNLERTDQNNYFSSVEKMRRSRGELWNSTFLLIHQLLKFYSVRYGDEAVPKLKQFLADMQGSEFRNDWGELRKTLRKFTKSNSSLKAAMRDMLSSYSMMMKQDGFRSAWNDLISASGGFFSGESAAIWHRFLLNFLDSYHPESPGFAQAGSRGLPDLIFHPETDLNRPGLYQIARSFLAKTDSGATPGEIFSANLASFSGADLGGADEALKKLLFTRRDGESLTVNDSSRLEDVLVLLQSLYHYGFRYRTSLGSITPTGLSRQPVPAGESPGPSIITVGDVLYSFLGSGSLSSAFSVTLHDNEVLKDGQHFTADNNSDGRIEADEYLDANSPVISLLQGPDADLESVNDPINGKSLPHWVIRVFDRYLRQGYGPYYNRNRTDSRGNFLSLSGAVLRMRDGGASLYQDKFRSHTFCVDEYPADAPMGLLKEDESASLNCANGRGYDVAEMISAGDPRRAVSTDGEALRKNLYWLLYEKRFYFILPTNQAGAISVFLNLISNGLVGFSNLKWSAAGYTENGLWTLDRGVRLKNAWNASGPFTGYSSRPGDAVVHLDVISHAFSPSFANSAQMLPIVAALPRESILPGPLGALLPELPAVFFPELIENGKLPSGSSADLGEFSNGLIPAFAALLPVLLEKRQGYYLTDDFFRTIELLNHPYFRKKIFAGAPVLVMNSEAPWPVVNSAATSMASFLPGRGIRDGFGGLSLVAMLTGPEENSSPLAGALRQHLLSSLLRWLSRAGASPAADRRMFFEAIAVFSRQWKLNMDGPLPTELNCEQWVLDLSGHPDTTGVPASGMYRLWKKQRNLSHSDWDSFRDFMDLAGGMLSPGKTSIIPALRGFSALVAPGLNPGESSALISAADSLLAAVNDNGEEVLEGLLSTDLPALLLLLNNDDFKTAVQNLENIAAPAGFLPYLFSGNSLHSAAALSSQTELFLFSELIQSTAPGSFWSKAAAEMRNFSAMVPNKRK